MVPFCQLMHYMASLFKLMMMQSLVQHGVSLELAKFHFAREPVYPACMSMATYDVSFGRQRGYGLIDLPLVVV